MQSVIIINKLHNFQQQITNRISCVLTAVAHILSHENRIEAENDIYYLQTTDLSILKRDAQAILAWCNDVEERIMIEKIWQPPTFNSHMLTHYIDELASACEDMIKLCKDGTDIMERRQFSAEGWLVDMKYLEYHFIAKLPKNVNLLTYKLSQIMTVLSTMRIS